MSASTRASRAFVLWMIWSVIFLSLFFYQFTLHRSPASVPPASPFAYPGVLCSLGALLGTLVIRWLVLPRATGFVPLLVCLIVGLALSETIVFFEIEIASIWWTDGRVVHEAPEAHRDRDP